MTQKDGSPEASEGPYWSEELLAVLVVGLGDETHLLLPVIPTALQCVQNVGVYTGVVILAQLLQVGLVIMLCIFRIVCGG